MGPNHGAWNVLPEIHAEVRVVCGETSSDIGPPLAAQIAERLPRGTLEVMPGLGHFGPQQDPDACAASILDFC
jgi:pimeloyl-ACP methyl ester carboxylesterase